MWLAPAPNPPPSPPKSGPAQHQHQHQHQPWNTLSYCPSVPSRHRIYSLQSGPVHSTSLRPVLGGILNSVFLDAIPLSRRLLPSAASIRALAHSDTLHSLGPDSTLINPSFSSFYPFHPSTHQSTPLTHITQPQHHRRHQRPRGKPETCCSHRPRQRQGETEDEK